MAFSRAYARASDFLDERPAMGADWKWLLAAAALGFCCALGARLADAGKYLAPALMAGDQAVMSTHDAYCWLAGAEGVNSYGNYGMSALARGLAALFGAPLWKVGFWAPAFLGSLVAAATALWGWLLAGRRGMLAAACLGALSPGFFFRSRLGYFDSDLFTLLMPLLLGFCLAHLLSYCCTRAWRPTEAERAAAAPEPSFLPWLALGYGLLARVAHFAHDDIHVAGVLLVWIAFLLALLTARPGGRARALRLLAVYVLAGYGGVRHFGMDVFRPAAADWACIALAAALAGLIRLRPRRLARILESAPAWAAVFLCAAAAGQLFAPLGPFAAKAAGYLKPPLETNVHAAAAAGPVYPGITQSIREARDAGGPMFFLAGLAPSPGLAAAGLAGVLALLFFRPAMALMLPLLAAGAASLFLGVRFAMFGGPEVALGLGVGLHWLLKALLRRKRAAARRLLPIAQGLLAAAGVFFAGGLYSAVAATPVLSPQHALALRRLGRIAPRDAEVWTWWDYGYATQFYARRMTPIDGGRHAGRDVFPTALALTTPSLRQAAQVILFSAGQQEDPSRRWDKMTARAVRAELAALAAADVPLRRAPAQYLVVSWDDVALLPWIGFYGTWDVAAGTGVHPKVQDVTAAFTVDTASGLMTIERSSGPEDVRLRSLDEVGEGRAERLDYPRNVGGPHLVINDAARQTRLMDDLAYDSAAVRLLLGDPAGRETAGYFKLVHEGFPLVRIYEVLPPAERPAGQAEASST